MTFYKEKYLKYKNKYLELKSYIKQLGGNNDSLIELRNKLEKLYPNIVFDRDNLSDGNSLNNTTYGEMNYEGIDIINKKLNISNSFNTFIDIGSGRGKLVLWYGMEPGITKSIGIELVESRHKDAIELKEKLSDAKLSKTVEFINGDFMNIKFSSMLNPDSKVLIWMSNLCFPPSITDKIFGKIANEFSKDTIICCSKITSEPKVSLIDEINIPMSWTKNSTVYVYKL
jgi:hypothetical protein